ncbi:MAG TPA: hypothetical protein ENN80_00460, partial [Candidatus Hydrogenedentes bacterium]|nr:hypothetical protein [Candidatus Hydrogenedentota bacterium]
MKKAFSLVLMILSLSGCVITKINAQLDESVPPQHYTRILVDASLVEDTTKASVLIENQLVKALSQRKIEAISATALKAPDWQGTQGEFDVLVTDYKPDAILKISHSGLWGKSTTTHQVAPQRTTYYTV